MPSIFDRSVKPIKGELLFPFMASLSQPCVGTGLAHLAHHTREAISGEEVTGDNLLMK